MLDILNKFIAQSQDGDLKTKNYPKKYPKNPKKYPKSSQKVSKRAKM